VAAIGEEEAKTSDVPFSGPFLETPTLSWYLFHAPRRHPAAERNSATYVVTKLVGTGILKPAKNAFPPMVGGTADSQPHVAAGVQQPYEEARSSTNKTTASGQN
jgi:hypothetical protein